MNQKHPGDELVGKTAGGYIRRRRPPLWKIVQQIMDEMDRQSAAAGPAFETKRTEQT
jgi:hypothetical protein